MWLLGTGEVDIGTSQDELWDKTRSFFGILEGDISTYLKVITIFHKMKNDLTTGTWQDDIWCPINIILLWNSDVIKYLSSFNSCDPIWKWVEGHAVKNKGWANCNLPERLNDQADRFAKSALVSAIAGGSTIKGDLPFEVVKLSLSGRKVSGSLCLALEVDWGYQAAESLFDARDIIWTMDFHLVWSAGLGAAMYRYPIMYHVWLTKHVLQFCGTNVQLYHWIRGAHLPKCKSCGTYDKYAVQICWCMDPGHDRMFQMLVTELCTWITNTLGEMTVASTVEAFLLYREESTMASCLQGNNANLALVAECSDRLRWDSLVEGQISTHWLPLVVPFLHCQSQSLLPLAWVRQLIMKLHNILHKQWIYRNSYITKAKRDGQYPRFRTFSTGSMDPESLLPRHRFLFENNFAALGNRPMSHCLWWLVNMDSAFAAALLAQLNSLTPQATTFFAENSEPPCRYPT